MLKRVEQFLDGKDNRATITNAVHLYFSETGSSLFKAFFGALAELVPKEERPTTGDSAKAIDQVREKCANDPYLALFERWVAEECKFEDGPASQAVTAQKETVAPEIASSAGPKSIDWTPLDSDLKLLEDAIAQLRAAKTCDIPTATTALERANAAAVLLAEELAKLAAFIGEAAPSWSTREDYVIAWQRLTSLAESKEKENLQETETVAEIASLLGGVRIPHRLPTRQDQLQLLAKRAADEIAANSPVFLPLLRLPEEQIAAVPTSNAVSHGRTWLYVAWSHEGVAAESFFKQLQPVSPALAELLAGVNWSDMIWPEYSVEVKPQLPLSVHTILPVEEQAPVVPEPSEPAPSSPAAIASTVPSPTEPTTKQSPAVAATPLLQLAAVAPPPLTATEAHDQVADAARSDGTIVTLESESTHTPVPECTNQSDAARKPETAPLMDESAQTPIQLPAAKSPGSANQVWRLASENRLGLASHLASIQQPGTVTPGWIFEAALLGPRVTYQLSPISDRLTELFLKSADFRFDSLPSAEQPAARLLLAGAALRPAILAPQSNAASVLKLTEFKEQLKLTGFDAVVEAVAEFGLHREPLRPAMLRSEHDRAEWEQQLAQVRIEISDWVEKAPHRNFNYAPATRIWRDWTSAGGKLRRLLDQTATATPQTCSSLELAWKPWRTSPDEQVQAAMKEIKQRFVVVGTAREALIMRIGEAVELANRFFALVAQTPRQQEGFREEQVHTLLDTVHKHAPAAHRELEKINSVGTPIPLRAAASLCLLGLKQIEELLRGLIPMPGGEEANPRWLVDAELLREPTFEFTGEGLICPLTMASADKLLSLAISTPDWLQAWSRQMDGENHAATAGLVEFFRWDPQQGISLPELRQQRQRALDACRHKVEKQADATRLLLDEFAKLGLCREKDYLDWNGEVEAVKNEALAESTIQFAPLHARLRKVRNHIEQERDREATKVRNRLEAAPQVLSDARNRILVLLEAGDVHTATDYLDRAAEGKPLPDQNVSVPIFRQFFGDDGWLSKAEPSIRQSAMHDCWLAARDGRDWHGLDFISLGSEQRIDTASHLQLWVNIERQRHASDDEAKQLVAALGLQPLKVRSEGRRSGRTVVQQCDLKAERLDEREASVVAPFGSDANGRYALHLVWGELNVDDLISQCRRETGDTSAHVIVCFRFLFQKERRELAEAARKRFFKAVVIDRAMFAFLCAQTGARFATFLRVALPFSRVEPYTISAGAVPPEIFYGRRRELESLADPRGSCFVYGGRQLGKTALLRALEHRFHQPDSGRAVVFVDLKSELFSRGRGPDDLWTLLVSKLKEANILGDKVGASAGHEALSRHISEWLDKDPGRRLLLLLDESDSFLEQDGKETSQREPFPRCQRLKNLMETTGRRFKVVFAGLHNVQRTTRVSNHPLAHFGEAICVGPMLEEAESREARALVEEPLAAAGYFFESTDAVSRILALTNYYPSLIQLFCHHLLADLRENHATRFANSKSAPPCIISSAHVQAAYGSRVRQAIHDKVNLTLHLDSRYELIAYLLAFYHASGTGRDELELHAIRDEAAYFWPKGFEEMRTDDEFRSLLEEMVGLGILRQASATNRFALRNPNVMMLLGTDEEIVRRLDAAKTWEPALRYEADKFRRIIAERPHPVFSPLTAQSEGELRATENRVAVAYGLPAAGLEDLQAAMESDGLFGKARTVVVRGCSDPVTFSDRIAAIKREPPHTLALVPSDACWNESWIAAALQRVEQFTSKDAYMTVLFVADAQRAAAVVPALDGSRESGIRDFTLRPWHDAAVRQWLQDLHLGDDREMRQRIYEVTGNWPILLARLNTANKPELLSSCEDLANKLKNPAELQDLKPSFGLAQEPADSPLRVAAEARRFTPEWICEFLGITAEPNIRAVAVRLQVAEKLGLVSALGSEWEFDPIAARILLNS